MSFVQQQAMRLIILGPPGSGKGTVAQHLEKTFNLKHISAGELLREEVAKETTLGQEIKKYINQGKLVPTNFVAEMIKLEVEGKDNYVLDGFPRSLEQAELIDHLPIDLVLYLDVPEAVLIDRFAGRRMDPETGEIYHLKNNPPPPAIAQRVVQRADDVPEVVKRRLIIYKEETAPVREYYRQKGLLITIDGSPAPDVVFLAVDKIIRGKITSETKDNI